MTGMVFAALLLAPAAPVPAKPQVPAAGGAVDRVQAENFARVVFNLAALVERDYVKKVGTPDLMAAAVRGLYDETGQVVPDKVKNALAAAVNANDLVQTLADVRVLLGNHPNLSGAKSLFAAMNGFKHATDPICGLHSARVNTYASVDQDFGVGLELEGVVGTRWAMYQVESGVANGRVAAVGWFGPIPRADAIPSPAGLPWKVRRVIPGSPAQRSGVKPGDVVTHFNGAEVTADEADKLFALFVAPPQVFDPATGRVRIQDRTLTFRRGAEKPFSATLQAEAYSPESAYGVVRVNDGKEGKWDCMLDRQHKIGYIRLGPIETGLDEVFADMMSTLSKRGCRGLILDLRWCPGGYVDPGTKIAGMFLKDGSVIAKMEYRNPSRATLGSEIVTPPGGGKYADLPLVILVGQETTGGGELIASALRDNDRCVVVGQRSVGRASIQNTLDAGFGQIQFRVTTGTSFRPNGKNRQRLPDSQPTDDWGVRPDPGLEVPVTADKSVELRRQAELHSLRPADSSTALPFDDPDADPYRLTALTYLRKKLPLPPPPK